MKSIKILCRSLFLLVAAGLFLPFACLAGEGMVARDLAKVGVAHYEAGRYEDAIHELSKVLLLEPRNETALAYLRKMGIEGGVYGYNATPVNRVAELGEEILGYQQQLEELEQQRVVDQEHAQQLEAQKADLQNVITQKEQEKQQLEELRAAASMKMKEQQEVITSLETQSQAKTDALVTANADLYEMKGQLLSEQRQLEDQQARLAEAQSVLDAHLKSSVEESRMTALEYEKKLAELQKQRDDLEHEYFTTQDKYRQDARRFNAVVRQKEDQIALGKNQLTIETFRAARQQKELEAMRAEMLTLRQQKTALEKEQVDLQKQIREAARQETFRYASSPAVPDTSSLADHVRQQDQMIFDLKKRLVEYKDQIDALKKSEQKQDQGKLSALQSEADRLERQIQEKEKELAFSKEQQEILQDRIKDYQERLKIVEDMIKDKEERINFLEEQLGSDLNGTDAQE